MQLVETPFDDIRKFFTGSPDDFSTLETCSSMIYLINSKQLATPPTRWILSCCELLSCWIINYNLATVHKEHIVRQHLQVDS